MALADRAFLLAEVERLTAALEPFVVFWGVYGQRQKNQPDTFRFYDCNGTAITFADFRNARAALNQEPAQ
jgi:hypothetical protein